MPDEREERREHLAKAWEAAEKEEPVKPELEPEIKPKVEAEPVKVVETKDEGTPEKKDEKPIEQKPDDTDKKEAKAAADLERKPATPSVTDRAPNSWKPAVREHWAKLPPEVREEVNRREMQIQKSLSETAQVRKFAGDFASVVNPFAHLIRAQNSTPLAAVQNLMQTAAGLMQGNPQQKAAIVADIINNYGIDIQVLDRALTVGYQPENVNQPPQAAVPPWAQPIFGFMDEIQRNRQQQQSQLQFQADQEIAAIETQPFFDDLRDEIADIMEVAAKRGRIVTLSDAYKRAINDNPEISKIVKQRELAENNSNPISQAASTLAKARRAASTISGAPAVKGNAGSMEGKSRREILSAQWDDRTS